MNRRKLLPLFFCICTALLCSCSNENIAYKKGEQAFAIGEYHTAAAYFRKSYQRIPSKQKEKRAQRAFMMGDCYRRINLSLKAVSAFQNAVRYHLTDSLAFFYLAQQQLKLGKYKEAEQNFRRYLELDPTNELAHIGLLSCELGPQWKAAPNLYKVKREPVFNGRRSDFCPMLVPGGSAGGNPTMQDADARASEAAEQAAVRGKTEWNINLMESEQLVFSSTRNDATGEDFSGITGVKFADLVLARRDESGKWKQPEVVESEVNGDYDEGACCFSPDGKTMYFTR